MPGHIRCWSPAPLCAAEPQLKRIRCVHVTHIIILRAALRTTRAHVFVSCSSPIACVTRLVARNYLSFSWLTLCMCTSWERCLQQRQRQQQHIICICSYYISIRQCLICMETNRKMVYVNVTLDCIARNETKMACTCHHRMEHRTDRLSERIRVLNSDCVLCLNM